MFSLKNSNGKDTAGWIKRFRLSLLAVIAGMILGYLYYVKVGCVTGTCPISSNPYISTVYGGVLGYLVSVVFDGFRFGGKAGEGGRGGGEDQPGQPQKGGG